MHGRLTARAGMPTLAVTIHTTEESAMQPTAIAPSSDRAA